jgi:hypothetical protein
MSRQLQLIRRLLLIFPRFGCVKSNSNVSNGFMKIKSVISRWNGDGKWKISLRDKFLDLFISGAVSSQTKPLIIGRNKLGSHSKGLICRPREAALALIQRCCLFISRGVKCGGWLGSFGLFIALEATGERGSFVRLRVPDPMRWMMCFNLPNPFSRTRPQGLLSF